MLLPRNDFSGHHNLEAAFAGGVEVLPFGRLVFPAAGEGLRAAVEQGDFVPPVPQANGVPYAVRAFGGEGFRNVRRLFLG